MRHVTWASYREYQGRVRDAARADLAEHLRAQVFVSIALATLTGIATFAATDAGFFASLGAAVLAAVVWIVLAAAFFHSRAHVVLAEDTATRERAAVELSAKLQSEIERRDTVEFDLRQISPEFHGNPAPHSGFNFGAGTYLFVEVRNVNGPTGRFIARYSNVRGVRRFHGDGSEGEELQPNSTWHALAWEDYPSKVIDIGYHGTERLFVAECFRDPFAMWFRLPESAAWGQTGHGAHALSPPMVPEPGSSVVFDLLVVNQTDNKEIRKTGVIRFGSDLSVRTFELIDPV